jgi:hypothetical protein
MADIARLEGGNTVDIDNWFADPARRRLFLLVRALEHKPLAEALCLAQAAEAFVTGKGVDLPQLSGPHTHQPARSLH